MIHALKAFILCALVGISAPAYALDLNNMSDVEKQQFGQQVRAYLLENPDIILEVFDILKTRQQQDEQNRDADLVANNLQEIQNDGFSWVGGNLDGDITLVEFMDYKCSYCRKAHKEIADLVKTDGNIRMVVKEYPILSQDSFDLSRAAIATLQNLGPDAYKKIYDKLIQHNGPVTPEAIGFIAKKLGLDGDTIVAHMDDAAVLEQIKNTRALGDTLDITGTPTFVINDQILRGYVPPDSMRQIVAELRARIQ